jgi:hypothetical protein
MSYLIVLRYDAEGTSPIVVREDEALVASDGVRWRLVAQTDDADLAARIVEQLRTRHAPQLPASPRGRSLPISS